MPLITAIRKVEYQRVLPTSGPLVAIEGVRSVSYSPFREYSIKGEFLFCEGYLALDGSDIPEQYADLVVNDTPSAYDLFVYYKLGNANRRKQFKGVVFCASFLGQLWNSVLRIGSIPETGSPEHQRLSFVMTFNTGLASMSSYLITING